LGFLAWGIEQAHQAEKGQTAFDSGRGRVGWQLRPGATGDRQHAPAVSGHLFGLFEHLFGRP
jgi:hypothetical protein